MKYKETELCKLAIKYGSDKAPKFKKHTYTIFYNQFFKNKRKSVKKILEIGIGGGGSLKMWQDFFPKAEVYGIDYRPELLINEGRIKSFLFDQRRRDHLVKLVQEIGSDIDIVIDDGSHRSRDQVFTLVTLMPLLKQDVIYIIEDVADPTIALRLRDYQVSEPEIPYIKRYDNKLLLIKNKEKLKLSIFAKKPFKLPPDGHLARLSSIIRGQQVAEYLDIKLNPTSDYKKDIVIYVKPPYKKGEKFNFEGKKSYIDVVDEYEGYTELLLKNPDVGIISVSDWNYKMLKKLFPKNKIINIPQHHCNFERAIKKSRELKTIGIIGNHHAFKFIPNDLKSQLLQRGIKLLEMTNFTSREDIVNFYMNIDLQIVWRPFFDYSKNILVNPLKIVNAASFGIPTLALDEPVFEEVKGCYLPVNSLEDLLTKLDKLMIDPEKYQKIQKTCLETAEKYHIENIGKEYEKLV